MSFNLLDEEWIPVLRKDGHSSRVGIIEALAQAGRIRQIAASPRKKQKPRTGRGGAKGHYC